MQRYERLLRRQVEPLLGDLLVAQVSPQAVRAWRLSLLEAGTGEVTVAKAYRFLKTVLNTAVDDEVIRRNPCRIKGAGQEPHRERSVPTMPEVVALADQLGDRWRALVLLAAFGALRWGELAALRRRDVDTEGLTVRVARSQVDIGGQLIDGPTKSSAGRRLVHLPFVLEPVLVTHMTRFAESGRNGRVFVGERGGQLRRPGFQRRWVKATSEVGLQGLRFHDLRHAGATWAAQAGATIRELQDRLGHSSSAAAMRYQHSVADRGSVIAANLSTRAEDVFADRARGGHEPDGEAGEPS